MLLRLAVPILAAWALSALALPAMGAAGPDRGYRPISSGSPVQDENFYLLTLLQRWSPAHAAVVADPELEAVARKARGGLEAARTACKGDPACKVKAMTVADADIAAEGDQLVSALRRAGVLDRLADRHLRPSGRFERYRDFSNPALVRQAWIDAAQGIDRIFRIYGLGDKPLYPLIDASSYPVGDAMWRDAINDLVDVTLEDMREQNPRGELFFDLSLQAALDMLYMNGRDEPARFHPLASTENAKAVAYAKRLDWRRWPYPAMLIPGRSPTLKDDPLSPEAKMKLRLAARRFRAGRAPIIVVSGGYVSPMQTRFNEALEMKRELMRAYAIPERAILIDPYARHTTTNLRNTERLLFEAGAPLDRPILVTTTDYQSRYIEGQVFHDRCLRELGYLCFTDLKRLSLFDTELKLPLVSLHRDASDPLDP